MDLVEIHKAFFPKTTHSLFSAGSAAKPGGWGGGESAQWLTTRQPGAIGRMRKRPGIVGFTAMPHGATPTKQQFRGMKRSVARDAKLQRNLSGWDKRFGHLPGNQGGVERGSFVQY